MLLLILPLLAGCRLHGPRRPHQTIAADAEPLRSAFNADSGKVRALLLVSPT